jgi:hypothetical protein
MERNRRFLSGERIGAFLSIWFPVRNPHMVLLVNEADICVTTTAVEGHGPGSDIVPQTTPPSTEISEVISEEEELALKTEALHLWEEHDNGEKTIANSEEAIAPILIKLRKALHAPGKKGQGFDAWLKSEGKPKATAYRWIARYCKKYKEALPWDMKQKAKAPTLSHVGQGDSLSSLKLKDVEGVLFNFLQGLDEMNRGATASQLVGWINGQVTVTPDFVVTTNAQQVLKLLEDFSFDGDVFMTANGMKLNCPCEKPIVIAHVKAAALSKTLRAASRFANKGAMFRYVAEGVHLSIGTSSIRAHAGDGHMMFDIFEEESCPNQPAELFIPNLYLPVVRNICSLESDTVTIATTSNKLLFSCPPRLVGFKMIEGVLLPGVDSLPCDVEAFIVDAAALRKSLLKARRILDRVVLSSTGSTLLVSALDSKTGKHFKEVLPAKVNTEQSLTVRTDGILKFLNGADNEIKVSTREPTEKNSLSPVLFEAQGRRFISTQIHFPSQAA